MRFAEAGIIELQKAVDTLIIIPNQNLFRVANEKTTFADAFAMADQVLYSGVACITDLMVKEGLINLDFADVRAVMREMGKAMMGTGEASGEKRSLRAAEAAIANPLIDDVSMRGAKGLLISITGGNDLTLYEVDEAATRIREEVDADANIIVGATFDESLEGIIRVSVVATGVDQVATVASRSANTANAHSHEARIAEVAQRARAEAQRTQAVAAATAAITSAAPAPVVQQPQATQTTAANPQAAAAVAAALSSRMTADDLTIRPIPQKPSLFAEPIMQEKPMEPATPAAFIPPQAEKPAARAPRMPKVEDLPLPVQNQIRARELEEAREDPLEKPRMSLLQRLASVGLGGRKDESEPARVPAPRQMPPLERMPRPATQRAPMPQQADPVSEFAKRQAPQGLDPHGRQAPVHNHGEDDQLDIPAFLRRQAN
jgi:cell division protein FtsZ